MTRSSRPEIVFVLIGVALLAGVIALVIAGGSSPGHRNVAQTPAESPAAPPRVTAEPTASPEDTAVGLSEDAVRGLLKDYANAYDAEDTSALASLFASTITRTSDGASQDTGEQVLAEYQRQFDALDYPVYTLSSVEISLEGDGASVSADYAITSDNAGEADGSVVLHVVQGDSGPLIDSIDAESY
jgi:ketosteroid isomerase-like protein